MKTKIGTMIDDLLKEGIVFERTGHHQSIFTTETSSPIRFDFSSNGTFELFPTRKYHSLQDVKEAKAWIKKLFSAKKITINR